MVDTRPATLTRKLLGEFLRNPETIKAFENLSFNSEDLADVVSAIQAISVLTLGLSDTFENERVVTSDGEVQLTDGGPGGNLTFGLSNTGVTAAVYGSAAQTVQFTVNAKGRLMLAQAHALNTSNVTEGTNLYFTNSRARSALSNGVGMAYNSTTGVIDAGTVLAAYAGGDTPSAFTLSIVDSADAAAWRAAIGAGTSTVTPSALTKTDDTNVTLTLGGSPSTALLAGTSLTLGWTGTLAVPRGGTGLASYTAGDMLYATGATTLAKLAIGANNYVLTSNGSAPVWTANTGTGSVVRATSPTIASPTNTATTTINNTPSSEWGIDFAGPGLSTTVTIANGATYDLATGSGMVFIWDNALGAAAQIACWFGSTSIVWQSGTTFTITSGTASKINVFYNGGTGKYRIQNNSGGSVTLFLGMVRMRASS
ncbi:hypothetical protein [Sphingobium sp. YC-XJ3]|uniref:hypothetical protein n=1 Tax=Sphingobium sp. YC-XJ3 TaxID=3024245 RepID=UPI00235F2C9C|nr:hypothetical protein [Sphingobium sp. YC-XJ3]WDA36400.1 hypothetical protein PO876_23725 [Sphingobium sp. YC-XJ3]WDA37865.1 hypothetical protein PO876_06700 [Sphingobium sp. YC-XJ3]